MVLEPSRVVIFMFFSRFTLNTNSSSFWRVEFCRSQNGMQRMASSTLEATLQGEGGGLRYVVPMQHA